MDKLKLTLLIVFLFCCFNTTFAGEKDERAIRGMLAIQVSEWNKGSIDGYMHGYWQSDSMVFIGAKGPRYGYAATLSKYKEAYPDADHIGHLTTEINNIRQLAPDYYFIIGKWALVRNAGNVSGSYTLLVKKVKGQWVIICDHSS